MELKLHLDGSVEPLKKYLDSFLRIRKSILLEIDTVQRAIIAKTFSEDRSSIRFASIRFEDANLVVVSDTNESDRGNERIKVGILLKLDTLIQIIERFGSLSTDGKTSLDITITYDRLIVKDDNPDFVATNIEFKSDILKMRLNGFRIADFDYLSDETFQSIFNVVDPVSIVVSSDTVQSIIKTSAINKFDERQDTLVFYVDNGSLYVKDKPDSMEPNFVYKIGELDNNPNYKIVLPVVREFFLKMMDKTGESFRIILGHDGDLVVSRILFDSTESSTKIVVAGMMEG